MAGAGAYYVHAINHQMRQYAVENDDVSLHANSGKQIISTCAQSRQPVQTRTSIRHYRLLINLFQWVNPTKKLRAAHLQKCSHETIVYK